LSLGDTEHTPSEGYRFLKRRPAVLICLSAMLGIGLHRAWPMLFADLTGSGDPSSNFLLSTSTLAALALVPLALALIALSMASVLKPKWRSLLALVGVLLAANAFAAYTSAPESDHIAGLYPDGAEYVALEGVVREGTGSSSLDPTPFLGDELFAPVQDRDLPKIFQPGYEPALTFLLDVERDVTSDQPASGLVKAYVHGETELRAGQRVLIRAELGFPEGPRNPGESDLRQVYADQNIYALAFIATPELIEDRGQTWRFPFQQAAESVRAWVAERIGTRLSPRHSSLLRCLVLGDRQALTPDLRRDFLHAGSLHLLVVSGLHVMVLGLALMALLRIAHTHPRWRMLVIALVSLGYLVVTGMHLSTIRAVSLVVLLAIADMRKHRADTLNLLAVSALFVLALDPQNLFSLGFVLSYVSVLALSQLSSMLQPKRSAQRRSGPSDTMPVRAWRFSLQSMSNSLIVMLATFPVVLRGWFLIAPVALMVNVLVFGPLALLLGSAFLLPLAFFDWGAWLIAGWFEAILGFLDVLVRWAAALPQSHAYLAGPPLWWIIAWYGSLSMLLIAHRVRMGRVLIPGCLVLLLALIPWLGHPLPEQAELTCLDVRQGACAVLRTERGGVVVLDCGSAGRPHVGAWSVAPFLLSHGHREVDLLVLSHADGDHVNGVAELLRRVDVREVWINPAFEETEQGREIIEWLTPRVGSIRVVSAGDRFLIDGVRLDVLWPNVAFTDAIGGGESSTNAASLVVAVDLGFARAIVPGDAEDAAMAGIGDRLGEADVLLAPHHGSSFEHQGEMLRVTRAKHVVISSREGFSPDRVMARYAESARVWKTYERGAITLRASDGEGYEISVYLDDE